ncbi:MAG: hypothetical protein LC102_06455 [Ignavibacteriales bacterium]|nr:MAG: hypothetical protein F9K26_08500 [Ignavibacteriaceae bacterium]MBW7873312.1 hypothetical protein [Ignavibacteria bacterium]MCZ2143049.1 hypothetical protein [Ignavibacteriales bacterium]OQY69992.1 MAG: hypothetical protein B6D45_11995 [Ignavibacteriales bacterium UTCHB3]MBV6444740.1 hypothetical protein [Ignavibacteriaceae bacterium]
MKKLFLFLFLAMPIYAQLTFVAPYIGAGVSYFSPSSTGLNKFAEAYNAQRATILTKKMEGPSMTPGFSITGAFGLLGPFIDLTYSKYTGIMSAELDPTKTAGGGTGRDINLSMNALNMGVGLAFQSGPGVIIPSVYFGGYFTDFKTKVKGTNTKEAEDDFSAFTVGVGATLMIPLSNVVGVYVNPIYNFTFMETDFYRLYDKTSTNYNLLSDETKGGFGGFQINAGILIGATCLN